MSRHTEILREEYFDPEVGAFGEYCVPISVIGPLQISDIPEDTNIVVDDLPISPAGYELSISVTTVVGFPKIDVHVSLTSDSNIEYRLRRIERSFAEPVRSAQFEGPQRVQFYYENRLHSSLAYSKDYRGSSRSHFGEEVAPLLQAFHLLRTPDVRLFVCHASEDKQTAREFAAYVRESGAAVWMDECEIAVGDSIVDKIDTALADATHLALLLSSNSISKPWVRREMSASLMRQLADSSITVLPILLEDCRIPAILADIKYADCRISKASGFSELIDALTFTPTQPNGEQDAALNGAPRRE